MGILHYPKKDKPFSGRQFDNGKSTGVEMAEFHLAGSVSGSSYCHCWLTITLSWHMNRLELSLMLLVTTVSVVKKA